MAQQKLTVGDLRKAIEGLDDSIALTVQNNIESEDDYSEDMVWNGDKTHTTSIGFVFGAFARGDELVIDVAITDSEL